MTEYSKMAKGHFTSTGGAKVIKLPFKPDAVQMWNYTVANSAAASQNVASAYWDADMGQGFAIQQGYNATPTLIYDTVTANGISTFSAGQLLQFGAAKQVVASTKGTTTSFQVTAHGYKIGDVVIFEGLFQSSTTGMPQMNGIPFTVITVTDANNFIVNWNSNNAAYTNLSASPASAKVKQVLYPYLYFPGETVISGITTGTTTTVDTASAHNFVVGQEVAFRIPSQWGTVELNSLPNTLTPGSPVYGYVIAVTDFNTVVVNIDSTAMTAFTTNIGVTSVPGLSFPQIVAVGDVNTGGVQISSGSQLYPPPYSMEIGTTRTNTINGPAIQGAFVNNTSQGFVIGAGAGTVLTTSVLVGASTNVIYWRAFLHDMNVV